MCTETGLAAGPWCPAKVKGRVLAGDVRACEVHERHAVDARSGAFLCGECMAGREVAWRALARWPADIEAYLRVRGKPALPVHDPGRAAIAPGGHVLACSDVEESRYVKARRKTWAQLLARVYGVGALRCALCGGRRRIIAWITDPETIEGYRRHVGKWSPRGERSQPEGGGAGAKTPARGRFGGVQAARISARARAERLKSSRDR